MKLLPASAHRETPGDSPEWEPVKGLLVENVGDEVLVLDSRSGRIHQFNSTAGIVWKGLMRGDSLGKITAAVVERFDVRAARASRDAEIMIQDLQKLKLVESAELASQVAENNT